MFGNLKERLSYEMDLKMYGNTAYWESFLLSLEDESFEVKKIQDEIHFINKLEIGTNVIGFHTFNPIALKCTLLGKLDTVYLNIYSPARLPPSLNSMIVLSLFFIIIAIMSGGGVLDILGSIGVGLVFNGWFYFLHRLQEHSLAKQVEKAIYKRKVWNKKKGISPFR